MKVYIPCYFNNLEERQVNFEKVINQWVKLNYKVIVYWMNGYAPPKNNKIKYIISKPVNASIARNELLKIFYKSNENYAIFSDDDTFVKNKLTYKEDCLSLTNDFKKDKIETEKINSSLLIICNFKKKYNIQPYFDPYLHANQDLDFGKTLNRLGINTYRKSTNEVELYTGKSSMFIDSLDRIYKKQKTLKYLETKNYGNHSIKNI